MVCSRLRGLVLTAAALTFAIPADAQVASDSDVPANPFAIQSPNLFTRVFGEPAPRRRVLILCGHPGNGEFRTAFADTVTRLQKGLIENYGVRKADIWLQFGSDLIESDSPVLKSSRGKCESVEIAESVSQLQKEINPNDALWVIVIGHTWFNGESAWFNIPGKDIDQRDLGRLFESIKCREQVFWITTPSSGFYARTLSAAGRIVITATDSNVEENATQFPHVLAEVLDG